ncbi:MAG: ABC transporter substrate-binding protein, partial [Deltaproteobacteria bacterium]|nr:ABC transporter substrate-binding protein [Deltaproteobacteria bacterium]
VLARNWKRFSEEQKEQYVAEFKRYLTNSYGNRIERYDQQEVKITGEREESRGDVVVQTKILGGDRLVAKHRENFFDGLGDDGTCAHLRLRGSANARFRKECRGHHENRRGRAQPS